MFDRMDLTDLFVPVGCELEKTMKVVHLAYSNDELNRLRAHGIADNVAVFKEEIKGIYPKTIVDEKQLQAVDSFIIQHSKGAFNLNSAIQSDRGFALLSLEEAQRLTLAYDQFWRDYFKRIKPDIIAHETCSLMFNFLAAMHCAAAGAHYCYMPMVPGPGTGYYFMLMSGFDFICPELDRALKEIGSGRWPLEVTKSQDYLQEARKNLAVFLAPTYKRVPLFRLAISAILRKLQQKVRNHQYDRILDNIDYWIEGQCAAAEKMVNRLGYLRGITFDEIDNAEKYYFYPLHLEPEAVVLYHAHGIYKNQVKLIENIAAQLPPGKYLYVKDHPHDHGYRSADDYLTLKAIPNLRLIRESVPGKEVIAHSLGVITITGTAGFEALLLGKPVFTFGKTFYDAAPGVTYLRNVRDLRDALYASERRDPPKDEDLAAFLSAYLRSLHTGMTDYFAGRAKLYGIDARTNAIEVAKGIQEAVCAWGGALGHPVSRDMREPTGV